MKQRITIFVLIDSLLVFFAYLLSAFFKTGKEKALFHYYWDSFLVFLTIWIVASLIFGKYNLLKFDKVKYHFFALLKSNTMVLLSLTFMFFFATLSHSRFLFIITTVLTTLFEGILSSIYISIKNAKQSAEKFDTFQSLSKDDTAIASQSAIDKQTTDKHLPKLEAEIGKEAATFISKNVALDAPSTQLIATTTLFNVLNLSHQQPQHFVNIKVLNDVGRINKFIEGVNSILPNGGSYVGRAKLYHTAKRNIFKRYPIGINNIAYIIFFTIHRVLPKLYFTRSLYFAFTKGKGRVISKAETLGRLYSCGFTVTDEAMIDGMLYFACQKISKPAFDDSPTYGPLIRLNRYGKGGKMIGVYKMRTMHPYSEYLQDYVFKKYNLKKGGKFSNDFRITTAGKIMRKFWIDELPMFLNVFKGEMKIVGVRPLSKHYYNLYTPELRARRIQFKPGLVPPFYVDMPETLEEIMASENKYLEAYEKHPFRTDISYFFKAFYNILIKKARSQ